MNPQLSVTSNWKLVPTADLKELRASISGDCYMGQDWEIKAITAMLGYVPEVTGPFQLGDRVRKTRGSQWQGRIVGTYSTELTPEGYAVESEAHPGSVQIYPASALELVP